MGSGFVPERLPLQSRWPWLQNVDDVLGSGDEEEPGAQTPRSIATTNLGDVVAVPDAADYNSGDASASHKKIWLTHLSNQNISPEDEMDSCPNTHMWKRVSGKQRRNDAERGASMNPPDRDFKQPYSQKEIRAAQTKAENHNEKPFVGNCGWGYVNIGEMKSRGGGNSKVEALEQIMKRHPATILAFGEAGPKTEEVMMKPAEDALTETELQKRGLPKDHPLHRPSFEYLTIRGRNHSSLMMAVRKEHVQEFELLAWRQLVDKEYLSKAGEPLAHHTRMMVCKIVLDARVGHIGTDQIVMNVHIHHKTANGRNGKETLTKNLNTMFRLIKDHNVTVLMGDFNMALPYIVRAARTIGLTIDLAAWFPWKGFDGSPYMDSTGIFFINRPGVHNLQCCNDFIHNENSSGFLFQARETKECNLDADKWFRIKVAGGPGQKVESFLPKSREQSKKGGTTYQSIAKQDEQKLKNMLEPSESSKEERSRYDNWKSPQTTLVTCEKRLRLSYWHLETNDWGHHKGSHYPLFVTTQNPSRRTWESFASKHKRKSDEQRKKKETALWNLGEGVVYPLKYRPDTACSDFASKVPVVMAPPLSPRRWQMAPWPSNEPPVVREVPTPHASAAPSKLPELTDSAQAGVCRLPGYLPSVATVDAAYANSFADIIQVYGPAISIVSSFLTTPDGKSCQVTIRGTWGTAFNSWSYSKTFDMMSDQVQQNMILFNDMVPKGNRIGDVRVKDLKERFCSEIP